METSVTKVKVHCCRSCQRKAKKILEQAPGVQAVCMDKSEGLLTVTGDVEPLLLIEMVEEKVRKRVELWSFQRYPAHGNAEEGGGQGATKSNPEEEGSRDGATKEADSSGARDGKKAARRRADRERAGHADPAPAGLRWPGQGRYRPMAGPCQHHGDPGRPPFWSPHMPPPPAACCGPPLFLPPCPWFYPMHPPPMRPPPPYCYHHETRRPKQ